MDVADANTESPLTWNDLSQSNAAYSGAFLDATENAVITTGNPNPPDPPDPAGPEGNLINERPVNWGFNSTNMAQILYQNPMLLAVHGDEMIP